jgi:hypothetical protein
MENLNGRGHLGDRGVGGRILNNGVLKIRIEFKWLKIRTSGGLFWTRWWTCRFHKRVRISWPGLGILASQQGICSVDFYIPSMNGARVLLNCSDKTSTQPISGPVVCCCRAPVFERCYQRSSSFWLVTENLEWGSWATHSRNVVFPIRSVIICEYDDWLCETKHNVVKI